MLGKDYEDALSYFADRKEVFDIIVLDPPYASGYYNNALKTIFDKGLLSDKGVIVVESEGNVSYDDFAFMKSKRYHYGKTYVDILRRKTS